MDHRTRGYADVRSQKIADAPERGGLPYSSDEAEELEIGRLKAPSDLGLP